MTTEGESPDDPVSAATPVNEAPTVRFVNDLDPVELRVLGCLIEKESTTPDNYPLTTNSLTSACNQKTSRDPLMDIKSHAVDSALLSLRGRKLVRAVHVQGSRSTKHRHVADETLGLSAPQLAVLATLFLRGAQTPGELRQRAERLHEFDSTEAVEKTLESLAARGAARQLSRQPGQSATRWIHLAGEESGSDSATISQQVPAAEPDRAEPDRAEPDREAAGSGHTATPAATTTRPAPAVATPAAADEPLSEELAVVRAELADLARRFNALCDLLGEHPE